MKKISHYTAGVAIAFIAWVLWIAWYKPPVVAPESAQLTSAANTTNVEKSTAERATEIGEWPFRAGAATAAKLIWEHPNLYTNNTQVADAAWEYAQPLLKQLRATNSP